MTPKTILVIFLSSLLGAWPAFAGNKGLLSYAGRIIMANGQPEQKSSVIFTFQILAPNGCVLWQETSSAINMSGSGGAFTTQVGGGTNTAAGSLAWTSVFQNGVALGGGSLTGTGCTGTYTGASTDDRTMYVTINDGTGAQVMGPLALKAVSQNSMFAGYPVIGAPSDGQVLTFSNSSQAWQPATASGGGGSGTVTSVTATSPISVATGTTTPAISIATASGSSAGALSSADWTTFNSKLSAVAGSTLTSAQVWVGNSSNVAAAVSLSGDATITNAGVVSLKNTGTAGTYGSATQIPVLTTDAQGRITGVTNTTVTASSSPTGSAGGDLSGTYPNPTIAKINSVLVSSTAVTGGVFMYDSSTTTWKGKAFPACTTAQAPYYNSVADAIQCQAIALAWSSISSTPTTVSGYGITDALAADPTTGAVTIGSGSIRFGGSSWGQSNGVNVGISNTVNYDNSIAFGSSNTTGSADTSIALGINNSAATDVSAAIGRNNTASNTNAYAIGLNITNSIATSLMIGVSDSAKITILSSGFTGIDNTSPGYPLDVTGDLNSSTALRVAGTQVCTSSGCTSSSDRTLKENIKPLANSLDKILQLQGVDYDWKDKAKYGAKHQVGLIAQDLEKVYPEVVTTDSKTGLKSVAYDHLVAPVIEAIKVINRRVASLENDRDQKVAQQQRQIDSLRNENTAIKKYLCSKEPTVEFCKSNP